LNEQILVSSFVASLRGTTPASPKPAEGNVIPPWPSMSEFQTEAEAEAALEETDPLLTTEAEPVTATQIEAVPESDGS